MVFLWGDYSFEAREIASAAWESEFGVSSAERIDNYKRHFQSNLGSRVLTLSGVKFPFKGDGTGALNALYEAAKSAQINALTNGAGKYFGRFVITKISEEQGRYLPNGAFLAQSYTVNLEEVHD